MRLKIYNFFVNRHIGIAQRYHKAHDGQGTVGRLVSWLYLLWLNFAYYVLFQHWLGRAVKTKVYEEKRLPVKLSESAGAYLQKNSSSPEAFAEELLKHDVISFDVFDTLIFRPFSEPTDLFYIVGKQLGYMDFKRIRMETESIVRQKRFLNEGTFEVTLRDIWQELSKRTGINAAEGMAAELSAEVKYCYANPFMLQVWRILRSAGKHIIITTDMYLPRETIEQILSENGYDGYEKIFLSCEYDVSKCGGKLYRQVRKHMTNVVPESPDVIHVGDNESSDIRFAKKEGFSARWYPNVNRNSLEYRTYDLSPIIGGAYRGLVNNRLYNGLQSYTRNFEYGFVYGGLFAVGYCAFIHRYVKEHGTEKILFLSRDGEILQRAYSILYPQEQTDYAYISRIAAGKWSSGVATYDFLRKTVIHKVGAGKTLAQILTAMELDTLIPVICSETVIERRFPPESDGDTEKHKNRRKSAVKEYKTVHFKPDDKLTWNNVNYFLEAIYRHMPEIQAEYASQIKAAGDWYRHLIGDAKSAVAVDIGWAGSGALALRKLFKDEWKMDCDLVGIVAGTNTANNAEPDMSETMLLDGSLVSYLYSSQSNRDLYKKHDPAKDYNLYWELLTSSDQPSFQGFYYEDGKFVKKFRKPEKNPAGIREIQEGILTFVRDYADHFGPADDPDQEWLFNISGRDAYAPMLLAASYDERYLKAIYKDFELEVGV